MNLLEEFNEEDPVYMERVTAAENWVHEVIDSIEPNALNAYANSSTHDKHTKVNAAYDLLWTLNVVIGDPDTLMDTRTDNPEVYNIGKLEQLCRILTNAPLETEINHLGSIWPFPVFNKRWKVISTVRLIVELKLMIDQDTSPRITLDDMLEINNFLQCVFVILRNTKYIDLLLLIYEVNYT